MGEVDVDASRLARALGYPYPRLSSSYALINGHVYAFESQAWTGIGPELAGVQCWKCEETERAPGAQAMK